jgi:formylglycine-generating enzyme required for sulfatase activity
METRARESELGHSIACVLRAYAENGSSCENTELAALARAIKAGDATYTYKNKTRNWAEQFASDGVEWILWLLADAKIPLLTVHSYLVGFPEPACIPVTEMIPKAVSAAEDAKGQGGLGNAMDFERSEWKYDSLAKITPDEAKIALVLPRYAVRRDTNLVFKSLHDLSPESAAVLATHKHSLEFPSLASLTLESARALAQHRGGFSRTGAVFDDSVILGLSELSPPVAAAIAGKKGSLQIGTKDRPLKTFSRETAESLARFRGRVLTLWADDVPPGAQDALAACGSRIHFAGGPSKLSSTKLVQKLIDGADGGLISLGCGRMTPDTASTLRTTGDNRDVVFSQDFSCDETIARVLAGYPGQVTFMHLVSTTPQVTALLQESPAEQQPSGQLVQHDQTRNTAGSASSNADSGTVIENSIGMKLRLIHAGTFVMGDAGEVLARPPHKVTLTKPFFLGVYEVTNAEWIKVMGSVPSMWQDGDRPVERVSWKDAEQFCRRLSLIPEERAAGRVYRLPTEAEWEYACRAGTTTKYSFGDDESRLDEYAWFEDNSAGKTRPVGKKKPNPWGLYDMHGNVFEWCSDFFDYAYYEKSPESDPQGPASSDSRAIRNGSSVCTAGLCSSANRCGQDPSTRDFDLGLRLAMSPPGAESPDAGVVSEMTVADAAILNEPTTGREPNLRNSIGIELSYIPAGHFLMGDATGAKIERPAHKVTITKPFYLGVYEVTNAEWQSVMGQPPSKWTEGRQPVEMVSWKDASDFCEKLSAVPQERVAGRVYRLPTEAEWEYACRAGTTSQFSFGYDESLVGEFAWFDKNSGGKTHATSLDPRKPNAWGLHDMHGNVREWVKDRYDPRYYAESPETDPQGPSVGSYRVVRGACWDYPSTFCRSAARDGRDPAERVNILGFRVAMSVHDLPVRHTLGGVLAELQSIKFGCSPDHVIRLFGWSKMQKGEKCFGVEDMFAGGCTAMRFDKGRMSPELDVPVEFVFRNNTLVGISVLVVACKPTEIDKLLTVVSQAYGAMPLPLSAGRSREELTREIRKMSAGQPHAELHFRTPDREARVAVTWQPATGVSQAIVVFKRDSSDVATEREVRENVEEARFRLGL